MSVAFHADAAETCWLTDLFFPSGRSMDINVAVKNRERGSRGSVRGSQIDAA